MNQEKSKISEKYPDRTSSPQVMKESERGAWREDQEEEGEEEEEGAEAMGWRQDLLNEQSARNKCDEPHLVRKPGPRRRGGQNRGNAAAPTQNSATVGANALDASREPCEGFLLAPRSRRGGER